MNGGSGTSGGACIENHIVGVFCIYNAATDCFHVVKGALVKLH